jgi:hypothetical protein
MAYLAKKASSSDARSRASQTRAIMHEAHKHPGQTLCDVIQASRSVATNPVSAYLAESVTRRRRSFSANSLVA